jgi:hypothetical protein
VVVAAARVGPVTEYAQHLARIEGLLDAQSARLGRIEHVLSTQRTAALAEGAALERERLRALAEAWTTEPDRVFDRILLRRLLEDPER